MSEGIERDVAVCPGVVKKERMKIHHGKTRAVQDPV